jgi:2-hydroxycyclohexanecarboxyl-CoA dehydrogenase
MDLELKGKTAFITGAGQGVGRGIAQVLAAEGVKVAVNDYFPERADKVVQEIKDAGGEAMSAPADITNFDLVKEAIAKVAAAFGPIDILVNNAGIPVMKSGGLPPAFVKSDPAKWAMQVELNLYGVMHCCYSVLPSMIERKTGRIVSIISEAGRIGEENMAVYSGAKAGILGFTKAIAREVGRYAVAANCVAIGATAHEGTLPFLRTDTTPETDEILKKIVRNYPIGRGLGRIGRATDAANAVAFLASPKAAFITGQCLSVSGGFSMVS